MYDTELARVERELEETKRQLATAKRELGDMTLDRDCMMIELANIESKLATARGLLARWVEISSHAGCGDECRMSLCVKTRAFLAAKESDHE